MTAVPNGGRPGPDGLAFYVPPSPLVADEPGQVIWPRRLTGAGALSGAAENLLVSPFQNPGGTRHSQCQERSPELGYDFLSAVAAVGFGPSIPRVRRCDVGGLADDSVGVANLSPRTSTG